MLVDLHHHILYGMDDGARTFEDTMQMILAAKAEGIVRIAATPHAVPGREYFHMERYWRHLRKAQEWCSQNAPEVELCSGAEIFYTEDTVRLLEEEKILTLNGTRNLLLEFPVRAPFEHLLHAARTVGNAGYQPVFAHAERYRCLRSLKNLRRLHEEFEVLIQINADSILHPDGWLFSRWMRHVLEEELADAVASDAHNIKNRKCTLGECFDKLKHEYGEACALRLCSETPASLLTR